jgi:outer membrane receptor protein involved in Fe transport
MNSMPNTVRPSLPFVRAGACLAALAACSLLSAQSPAVKAPAADSEAVVLDPFVVSTDAKDGYFSKTSTAAGRVAIALENIPQHVEVFNAQFIADIMPQTMMDILKFSTAVQFSNSERQSNGGLVRGFDASVTMRNGMNGFFGGGPSYGTEAIEQVEIIRGPAAALYGASQPGGLINYVTKRPQFTQSMSATFRAFSVGGYSASVDLTGPLNIKNSAGEKMIAYRFILADEDRGGYQINNDFTKRKLFYGRVTVKPVKTLTLDLEHQFADSKTAFFNSTIVPFKLYNPVLNGTGTAIPYKSLVIPNNIMPADWTYQDDGTHRNEKVNYTQFTALWAKDFGKWGSWAIRAFYAVNNSNTERLLYSLKSATNSGYPGPVTAADLGKTVNYTQTVTQADITAGRVWIPGRYVRLLLEPTWDYGRFQYDLTGKFKTGPATHNVLVGTDGELGYRTRVPRDGFSSVEYQVWNTNPDSMKLAVWVDNPNPRNFSGSINWNDLRTTANPNGVVTGVVKSGNPYQNNLKFKVPFVTSPVNNYYFFDSISLLNDRLVFSLGARFDKLFQTVGTTTYTAQNWTYRYGAVYKVSPSLHLFGIYNGSFIPNSQTAAQTLGHYVAPQKGEQKEAGVRLPLLEGKLLIESSIYEITNTNVLARDIFKSGTPQEWNFIDGQQNRGMDFDVKLSLSKDTQAGFSYAHYKMVYFGNLAQVAAGVAQYPAVNVPNNQYSAWGKWTPSDGALRNFSFLAAYRFTGERPGGGTGAIPSFMMESYGVAELGVGYKYKKWAFNLRVSNLLDQQYLQASSSAGLLFPGRPREATLTATVKF